jgi:hypothetical protein
MSFLKFNSLYPIDAYLTGLADARNGGSYQPDSAAHVTAEVAIVDELYMAIMVRMFVLFSPIEGASANESPIRAWLARGGRLN